MSRKFIITSASIITILLVGMLVCNKFDDFQLWLHYCFQKGFKPWLLSLLVRPDIFYLFFSFNPKAFIIIVAELTLFFFLFSNRIYKKIHKYIIYVFIVLTSLCFVVQCLYIKQLELNFINSYRYIYIMFHFLTPSVFLIYLKSIKPFVINKRIFVSIVVLGLLFTYIFFILFSPGKYWSAKKVIEHQFTNNIKIAIYDWGIDTYFYMLKENRGLCLDEIHLFSSSDNGTPFAKIKMDKTKDGYLFVISETRAEPDTCLFKNNTVYLIKKGKIINMERSFKRN